MQVYVVRDINHNATIMQDKCILTEQSTITGNAVQRIHSNRTFIGPTKIGAMHVQLYQVGRRSHAALAI